MNGADHYGLRDTAIYNPHLLSRDELIGLFSARQELLDQLLEDLTRCAHEETPQHHLLIGQRGMGKTMLLRRLQLAIEDDKILGKHWLPLTFPEEQYDVAKLSDLWLSCLDALSDALERGGNEAAARHLDTDLEALLDLEEEPRARQTLDLLIRTAAGLSRCLVLLIDNVDLILDRITEQAWALREVLSHQPTILFIGASASALEVSYKYGQPFYEFFLVHELAGLSLAETSALLGRYAEYSGNSEIRRILDEEPARIRTSHALTGGNPRTIALLYSILGRGLAGDVRIDLEALLDLCTPLYKARLEALAPQQQRIIHALAVHWHPASAAVISGKLRLDVKAVSSQLTRLVRDGIVQSVPFEPESKTGFQLAERFFNIWYLMRSTRRARRRLIWLVEFLYRQEELSSHAQSYGARLPKQRLQLAEAEELASYTAGNVTKRFEPAHALARNGKWHEAFKHAEGFITGIASSEIPEDAWPELLLFFKETVAAGKAAEAGELLDRLGMGERWLPLRGALAAVACGRRDNLKVLAPEVRRPAEEILDQLGWEG